MNMANMNARIMRNLLKFILENDPDGKFNQFLDISKAQFELCGGVVPPSNTSQTFSLYQMVVYQIRQTRKMIKQEGDYDYKKSDNDRVVFPSNATQRQHMSIAKNFLDNNDPGWDDTDDEDVDDLNGLIPETAKKMKTDSGSQKNDSENDDDDNDDNDNDDNDDNDDDDDDYEAGEEDDDEDDEDDEEDGEECE